MRASRNISNALLLVVRSASVVQCRCAVAGQVSSSLTVAAAPHAWIHRVNRVITRAYVRSRPVIMDSPEVTKAQPFEGPYVAAIDSGTSSTRFMLFDRNLRQVVACQKQNLPTTPKPG